MIVYGKRTRSLAVNRALADLSAEQGCEPDRLLAAGELACGLLDWSFERRGADDAGDLESACHDLMIAAARGEPLAGAAARIGCLVLPESVEVAALPEGFAHYALDPDQYARAARAASGPAPACVIGVRTIGLVFGAVVAVQHGAPVFASVRPTGHPFHRELSVGPALRRRLLAAASRSGVAVVDEGPGLSGSSLAAVAGWLERGGVTADHIAFYPGHAGEPGPHADASIRRRWRCTRRCVVDPDLSFVAAGRDLGSPAPDDVGGGRWRTRLGLAATDWPPSHARGERRKLIAIEGGAAWLHRFAGLGRIGHLKAERARALATAGFCPPVGGLRRGFLAVRWLDDARPLVRLDLVPRSHLLARAIHYLVVRASMPPCDGGPGADPPALLAMARHNAEEALGADLAAQLDRFAPLLTSFAARARPVAIDGRLHRWEWIVLPDGQLLKTDAIDHCLGHDLVGEQDIAWDVAGAELELALDGDESQALRSALGAAGPGTEALELHRACYAAFQLGAFTMAACEAERDGDWGEAIRLNAEADRYRRALIAAVAGGDAWHDECTSLRAGGETSRFSKLVRRSGGDDEDDDDTRSRRKQ